MGGEQLTLMGGADEVPPVTRRRIGSGSTMGRVRLNVLLPLDTARWVVDEAAARGVPVSTLVAVAVGSYRDNTIWQQGGQCG